MQTTPVSLLERLRDRPDGDAWGRFVRLYGPLLYHWARGTGMQEADAADLVQDVFASLVEKLPHFAYDRTGSFRGWLRAVTLNRWRDRRKRRVLPTADGAEPAAADADPAEWLSEADYRLHLVGRAMQIMRSDFEPATWKACWEVVAHGRPAAEVAAELGLTVGAVHAARFRVLARLRRELAGLLE